MFDKGDSTEEAMRQIVDMVERHEDAPEAVLIGTMAQSIPFRMIRAATEKSIEALAGKRFVDDPLVQELMKDIEDAPKDEVVAQAFLIMVSSGILALLTNMLELAQEFGIGIFAAKDSTNEVHHDPLAQFAAMSTPEVNKALGITDSDLSEYECPQCGSPKAPDAWICTTCRESLN